MAESSPARTIGVTAGSRRRQAAGAVPGGGSHSSPPQTGSVLTGTRRLMFAVLQNGIDTYLRGKEHERSEAEDWVRSERHESPFSFTVLCEEFSLDPSAVRAVLAEWRNAAAPGGAIRARPYSRRANQIAAPTKAFPRKRRARRKIPCPRR